MALIPSYRPNPLETRQRSVRIRNLPAGTQEGLLQQALEKLAKVTRVEVFEERREAIAELESLAVRPPPFLTLWMTDIPSRHVHRKLAGFYCTPSP